MREFQDESGATWLASVGRREGRDYKGRFYFRLTRSDDPEPEEVVLEDVQWNSLETAERSLGTMSGEELKRRLRSARGRAGWFAERIRPHAG